MERTLVGILMVLAPLALAVAAFAVGYSATHPAWWAAAVHLAVLGGITMMIYAVNMRFVPVFARRPWRFSRLVLTQIVTGLAGAWMSFLGLGFREIWLERLGALLVLAGGVLFMFNIATLFHQKPSGPPLPQAPKGQEAVDKAAIGFTKLSATWLLLGLGVGVMLTWWRPTVGRWDLVWAHAMLVGWFMTMAGGVSYHVLSRWTGVAWRSLAMVQWHYRIVAVGLPFMILALAMEGEWQQRLFLIAGPLQAVAIALYLANIAPLVLKFTNLARIAISVATIFLIFGVSLGIMFAIDSSTGPRLRQVHVMANVFGWAGLLISGFGYQFVPAFAGRRLIWPRLAMTQIGVIALGVMTGMYAMWARMFNDGAADRVMMTSAVVSMGLLLFAVEVAATFLKGRVEFIPLLRPGLSVTQSAFETETSSWHCKRTQNRK